MPNRIFKSCLIYYLDHLGSGIISGLVSTLWSFFVDDTTASEIVYKGDVSNAKSITDQVMLWSQENRM